MRSQDLNGLNEDHLLNQLSCGNEIAFTEIYNLYWQELFLIANRILKDEEGAKDVVQEIFVSLWQRREDLLIENLKSYLFSSAKRKVLQNLRNGKIAQRHIDRIYMLESIDSTEQGLNFAETNERLQRSMESLPDRCKEVFLLSRYEQLSHKEIAEKLKISAKTVEIHIAKALRYLRRSLSDLHK
jgi:RNA polymerase sigma-70 factor (ECF subfamily)